MPLRNVEADLRLRKIMAQQFGLVRFSQARRAGFTTSMLRRRVASGELAPIRRGVLADPAAADCRERDILAAVLAAGALAFASHTSAAWLWGLPLPAALGGQGADGPSPSIEVTTPLERFVDLPGVGQHRSGLMHDNDYTAVRGIPSATPERVAVDLSSRLSVDELGALVDEALRRRLTSLTRITLCVGRLPRAPGRSPKAVREMLSRRVPGAARESELEEFVYDSIRRFGLPLPVCQHEIVLGGRRRRLDMCYLPPLPKISLEVDGYDAHRTRRAFDDDRVRGNEVALAGFVTLHFTSVNTDHEIASQVARALGRPAPPVPAGEPDTFARWLTRRGQLVCSPERRM